MGKSTLAVAPPQVSPRFGGEEKPLLTLRRRRAVALAPTVRRVEGGYRVSSSTREISYLVTQPNGHLMCTCADYQRHYDAPEFKCKHVMAIELAKENGRLSENGHAAPEPVKVLPSNGLSILHRTIPNEESVRIKLIKNTKGYSWELSVADKDPDAALAVLKGLEQKVRDEFGG